MINIQKISKLLILILIIIYIYYLYFDNEKNKTSGRLKIIEQHLKNIKNNGKKYNALVIGGSNSLWGLSAKQLHNNTSHNFYNLSLLREGRNSQANERFISEISEEFIKSEQINLVIYSSIAPLYQEVFSSFNKFDSATNNQVFYQSLRGNHEVGIKPFTSYYQYVKKKYYKKTVIKKNNPRIDSFGDLDFSKQACRMEKSHYAYKMVDANQAAIFLNNKANFLSRIFPNAKIAVVIPSEYIFMTRYPRQWAQEVVNLFEANAKPYQRIIVQAPIPSFNFVCDANHHPNAKGREWRTQQLINSLKSKESISF